MSHLILCAKNIHRRVEDNLLQKPLQSLGATCLFFIVTTFLRSVIICFNFYLSFDFELIYQSLYSLELS